MPCDAMRRLQLGLAVAKAGSGCKEQQQQHSHKREGRTAPGKVGRQEFSRRLGCCQRCRPQIKNKTEPSEQKTKSGLDFDSSNALKRTGIPKLSDYHWEQSRAEQSRAEQIEEPAAPSESTATISAPVSGDGRQMQLQMGDAAADATSASKTH
ncbi:hypothetical protein AWZ03_008344 [Drosophila navojoa]|uniref:Uncharacterized protein n=1 Tax=Drosophila navojoa TaxID=7232 RepID=A0A484BAE6_DRONA|nr:hypothetical protein AWZ03_008344 [Drosophila navojoa]